MARDDDKFIKAVTTWARNPLISYRMVAWAITEPASHELFHVFSLLRLGVINIARQHVNGRMNLTPTQQYIGEQCYVMADALVNAFPDDTEIQDAWNE